MNNNIVLTLTNGSGDNINYFAVDSDSIKRHILGRAGSLIVGASSMYKSDAVKYYRFYTNDFKERPDLCAVLYGRDNMLGELCLTETSTNYLCEHFSNWGEYPREILTIKRDIVERYGINRGKGSEKLFADKFGCTITGEKYDLLKVDLIFPDRTLSQIKCSIMTERGKGKGSRTNGQIPTHEIIL